MRNVLALCALAVLVSGCTAGTGHSAYYGVQAETRISVGVEVGSTDVSWEDGDEWDSTSYRPFLTVGSYANGLAWDFLARGRFHEDAESDDLGSDVEHQAGDYRYRLGWGWELPSATGLSLLTGPSYRHGRMETELGTFKYDMFGWNLGARLDQRLGSRLSLFVEAGGDYLLTGMATGELDRADADGGYALGARAGLDFGLTKNLLLGGGVFYDYGWLDYTDDWETESEIRTTGAFVSITARF